jgi:toxin ParE1/3/4
MRLIYNPEAERELAEAAHFYRARSPGLGHDFMAQFESTVAEIQRFPGLWPVIERDVRSRTMRHFPFAVYYRVEEDELRILVVKHHSRHPDYWRHRLDE